MSPRLGGQSPAAGSLGATALLPGTATRRPPRRILDRSRGTRRAISALYATRLRVLRAEGRRRDVAAVIVDPHGHHLTDALDKLKALGDFAEEFAGHFMRIAGAVSNNEKGDLGTAREAKLVMLDLLDKKVRTSVRKSESAAAAYREAGIVYEEASRLKSRAEKSCAPASSRADHPPAGCPVGCPDMNRTPI